MVVWVSFLPAFDMTLRSASVLLVLLAGVCFPASAEPTRLAQAPEGAKAAPSAELKAYQLKARDKFIENWQPPDIDNDARVEVYMRIDRDGRVSQSEVKTLEGAKGAEDAVKEAIRRSVPFAEVPESVAPYYVDVRFRLKVAAKTPPTPACLPVTVFIAPEFPEPNQQAVRAALSNWTNILRESGLKSEPFSVVDSRDKAYLAVLPSTDGKLSRNDKTSFVGRFAVNESLSNGTIELGLKARPDVPTSTDITPEQLTVNTMQLIGKMFGLTSSDEAYNLMSTSKLEGRLKPEQLKQVTDTAKAADCSGAKQGFQVKVSDEPKQ